MTMYNRDAAYEALTSPAATLYRQLGACPMSWFDADALAVFTELDIPGSERLAETLVEARLLVLSDCGYSLTPHGQLHARVKAEECEDDERELNAAGLDRFLAFLNNAAAAAEHLITPSHSPLWEPEAPTAAVVPPFPLKEAAALDWLERRLPAYMDAIRFAFADQRYALACDLLTELVVTFSQIRGTSASVRACLNLRVLIGTWVVLWCVISVGWRRPGTGGVRIGCSTARAGWSIR